MIISYNLNQKMHSFIHFREISGFRRVITPFDLLFSQNIMDGIN